MEPGPQQAQPGVERRRYRRLLAQSTGGRPIRAERREALDGRGGRRSGSVGGMVESSGAHTVGRIGDEQAWRAPPADDQFSPQRGLGQRTRQRRRHRFIVCPITAHLTSPPAASTQASGQSNAARSSRAVATEPGIGQRFHSRRLSGWSARCTASTMRRSPRQRKRRTPPPAFPSDRLTADGPAADRSADPSNRRRARNTRRRSVARTTELDAVRARTGDRRPDSRPGGSLAATRGVRHCPPR